MADYSWEQNRADAARLADMLFAIYSCPRPVVGRIHGDCYAGGLGLAAVCDVLVAAEPATFCLSEARLGLLPATISPYVIRAMGEQAARRYFVTAERFSAAQAKAMGFVHETCAAEAIDAMRRRHRRDAGRQRTDGERACKKLVQDIAGLPSRRAACRHRRPHRRHPRQRRGARGGAELPAEAQARVAGRRRSVSPPDAARRRWPPRWAGRAGCAFTRCSSSPALAGWLGWVDLPGGLKLLREPVDAGRERPMLFVEFFADKIPASTRCGTGVHTLILIPAGAALAASVFGMDQSEVGRLPRPCSVARSPPPATSPRRRRGRRRTRRPSRSRTSACR